jgi:hypothetical protein
MIFELSNSFYTNLGLEDMTMCFDTPCSTENTASNKECIHQNPMIEKPDWDVVCHASGLFASSVVTSVLLCSHSLGHVPHGKG